MSFRDLRAILVVAAICVGACGAPPPSAVDEEMLFVDIETCARLEPACVISGSVGPAELLLEGKHAISLWPKPSCGPEAPLCDKPPCGPEPALCDVLKEECCSTSLACVAKGTCAAATVPPIPAGFSLPILPHSDDAQLAWLAIGVAATGPARTLHVKIDGVESIVQPAEGWARIELSGQNRRIAAGARLEITATEGTFGISWIIGRWKR